MPGTEGSGASRGGKDIFRNEDAYLVEDGLGLYVVCDGLSGRPAGEVASRIAVEALENFVERAERLFGRALTRLPLSLTFADRAVRAAIDAVLAASLEEDRLHGMATTLTMLLALGGRGVIGHVGDSRCYLIRNRRLDLLTVDHDVTEELSRDLVSPELNSALRKLSVDTFGVALCPEDVFVLCTDGARSALEEGEVARTALQVSPRVLASRIVSAANRANGDADATVVVVRVGSGRELNWLSLSDEPRPVSFGHVLAAA